MMRNLLLSFSKNFLQVTYARSAFEIDKLSDRAESSKKPVDFFFFLGLYGAFSFRSLMVFNHINPTLVKPIWYSAVATYILFFGYRAFVSSKRKRMIEKSNILDKLNEITSRLETSSKFKLTKNDLKVINFTLNSVYNTKENLNYLFIFIVSIIAIIFDLFLAFS